MRLPSGSPITLLYNATSPPYSVDSPHKGVDFAYLPDNKVYAPFSGRVTVRPLNGRDGNAIYMTNGPEFHGLLHLSTFYVADGYEVKEGDVLGLMGATGFAQGVHLHWCVKVDDVFIDPLTLIKENNMTPPVNRGDIFNMWHAGGMPGDPDENYLKTWEGSDWKAFMYDITGQGLWQAEYKTQVTCTPDERAYLDLLKKVSK